MNEGNIPLCPGKDCDHIITEKEVLEFAGPNSILVEKYSQLLLRSGLMTIEGCIACPARGCNNWIVLPDDAATNKVKCECECGNAFCSLCRELYHYRGSFSLQYWEMN